MYQPIRNDWTPLYWRWWIHWVNPRVYWKQALYFWQRGTRGWADCDCWSLDAHLCEVLVGALDHLSRSKHGIPSNLLLEDSDEGHAAAQAVWEQTVKEMIEGFQAGSDIITDNGAEEFFGPGPEKDESIEDFLKRPSEFDSEGYQNWGAAKQAVFDRGMKLFHKHYFNLWD